MLGPNASPLGVLTVTVELCKALLLPNKSVPPLIVVTPLTVFAPERVIVPVPLIVIAPLPLMAPA